MHQVTCAAIRQGDQMMCGKCALAWDRDDPEPPQCKPVKKGKK